MCKFLSLLTTKRRQLVLSNTHRSQLESYPRGQQSSLLLLGKSAFSLGQIYKVQFYFSVTFPDSHMKVGASSRLPKTRVIVAIYLQFVIAEIYSMAEILPRKTQRK